MALAIDPQDSDESVPKHDLHPATQHRHHGLSLIPRPSQDVNDPLRWPRWVKIIALAVTAMTNFTANFAGAGLSVAAPQLQQDLHKNASQVNNLMTFNFLFLGIGNMVWVPLAAKYGKRPILLISHSMLFVFLIWSAKVDGYNSLLAARSLSGFASAAGESIIPGIVGDIFFLHEHAATMSAYTMLITSSTAIGPLIASFVVQYSSNTWRTFIWACAALAGANVVAVFLFFPESNFQRPVDAIPGERTVIQTEPHTVEKGNAEHLEDIVEGVWDVDVVPKPFTTIWRTGVTTNPSVNLLKVALRPFIMVCCPDVILAVFMYGTALAAQVTLIYAFPSFLIPPPYNFSTVGVGLMEIAAVIGFFFGCIFGGYVADEITARVIIRHDGEVFPAQRLLAVMPCFWIPPAGCILTAFACSEKLHWVAIAFGFGMLSFNTAFAPNIIVTFVLESHPEFVAEALVTINVFKNMVAFLFLYVAVDWVNSSGWLQVYMIMFMLVSLSVVFTACVYKWHRKMAAVNRKIDRLLQ